MNTTEPRGKTVQQSYSEHVQIIMPEHINGANRLFGGKLVEWMDVLAGVVARRHSGHNITTAAIDNLQFRAPAYSNDTLLLIGRMTFTGRTSMEVRVDAYVEELSGKRSLTNTAYFIMVALDDSGRPVCVPPLLPLTPEEVRAFQEGKARKEARDARKDERHD